MEGTGAGQTEKRAAPTASAKRGRRSLPGVVKAERFRPRFHWELLVCGLRGHELVGLDARELRPEDAIVARQTDGVRWHRCLRCDSWLPFDHPPQGAAGTTRDHLPEREQIVLPLRGRPLRDKIVLRAIAIDRAFHFVVLALLSVAVFLIASDQADLRDQFYRVLSALHGGLGGTTDGTEGGIAHKIDKLLSLPKDRLQIVGGLIALYAMLEGVEAIGLWLQKRWAEYLTLIATAAFLPLEIYELSERITALKIFALILNIAVVIYLLYAKRLFGIRGGAAAEEKLRERDMGWSSLEATSPEAHATTSAA